MTRNTDNLWLHYFAVFTAMATLALIGLGGLVTSHGAGLAVPDWPTSYGYNMFALPFKFWQGGVFYEHTHRLLASGVGFLTTVLAVWLWLADSRRWLRWMGVIAFFLVGLQGLLGGLRVVLFKDEIGIFHATLAQLFFILTCAMALFTSRWWVRSNVGTSDAVRTGSEIGAPVLRRLFLCASALILFQLILGATMRHQHAGLAVPDFPLAYGRLWPDTDPASITRYNQQRVEVTAANPITSSQILLQMAHRIVAGLILGLVAFAAWKSFQKLGWRHPLTKVAIFWLILILAQVALGVATLWTNKAADIATLHVLIGALSLATGAVLCLISYSGFQFPSVACVPEASEPRAHLEKSFAPKSAGAR